MPQFPGPNELGTNKRPNAVHSRSLIYASYSCKQLLPAISASRSVTAAASLPICLATRRRRAKLPALLPQQCARVLRGAGRGAGVVLI